MADYNNKDYPEYNDFHDASRNYVERTLYREFKYVMDKYNISNNEPYVIFDRTKEFSKKD